MSETVKFPDYHAFIKKKIFDDAKEMILNANDEQLRMLVFTLWLDLHKLITAYDLGEVVK